ncbi:acyl-CoA dehydrogenase family protein [Qipengyuania sp. G39]|uniref:Acyl-CoA dehydrogenase family protein n=1 Tax=Qipengyuania profundimaris TaxID=3067652 RepID=A0ABT9HM82_9SPHN|nr:acyl-CoA dehydrogenase family protein [Qipengyuania sp. G39]MDP4574259.1 acyl-CoA dehydrogenase family protein [Qipengyuania sp. G39]
MNDTRRMLAEMADPLFAELGAGATMERDWARVEELGLPQILVSEADGGFGGTWEDALVVFRLAGFHALALPLPDAIIATRADEGSEAHFQLGAFARTAQIAGALDAALGLAVAYVNERQQFGRPLGKFQAVQQSLATFACEAAAANCAAMGAAQALDRGDARFEVAAAKLRANRAVGIGTTVAHQVHGAIGFTREYGLHELTRRLWQWRSDFGGDAHWSGILGDAVIARGADAFWPDLTARTD